MTEPTLEEMKKAVLKVYPSAYPNRINISNHWIMSIGTGEECLGMGARQHQAWRAAYSKLPKKPVEEKCTALCVGTVPCQLPKGHEGYHSNWNFELGRAVVPDPQSAPESEDEAFERWFAAECPALESIVGHEIYTSLHNVGRNCWNARARLSAGGK